MVEHGYFGGVYPIFRHGHVFGIVFRSVFVFCFIIHDLDVLLDISRYVWISLISLVPRDLNSIVTTGCHVV